MSKDIPEHRDILNRQINVGDGVVFSYGPGLVVGIVTKLNPKMVQVKKIPAGRYATRPINKYPRDVIVIAESDLTLYILKKGI